MNRDPYRFIHKLRLPIRIAGPALLSVVLFGAMIFAFMIPTIEDRLVASRKQMICELVETAIDSVAYYHRLATEGTLTTEAAQAMAWADLGSRRYGPHKKDYFWITGIDGAIIKHPHRPDLEGDSVEDMVAAGYADPTLGFARIARETGAGFYQYDWQVQDDRGRIAPKLAFVKRFAPWEWIVGTGVYLEDIVSDINAIKRRLLMAGAGVVGMVLVLSAYIFWQIARLENERQRAWTALSASEAKHRAVLASAPNPIVVYDVDGAALYINRAFTRTFGWTEEDVLGRRIDFVPPENREETQSAIKQAFADLDKTTRMESRRFARKGDVIDVLVSASVFRDQEGNAIGMVVNLQDISQQKQAERELKESRWRFQAVFQQTFQLTGLLEPTGALVQANRSALDFAGIEMDQVRGIPFWKTPWWTHSPAEQERLQQAVRQAAKGELVRFETTNRGRDGTIHDIDFSVKPLVDDEGRISLLITEGRDIGERKLIEQALRESEKMFRAIADTARDAIIMIDDAGIITFWSKGGETILGYRPREIIGMDLHQVLAPKRYHEAYFAGLVHFRREGRGQAVGKTLELTALHKEGYEIPVELSLASVKLKDRWHGVGILRDITERKRMEEHSQEIQRLESLGTLAGGIAHDFNNLMMGIQGRTSLLLNTLSKTDPAYDPLRSIDDHVNSAVSLTRQLLGFARSGKYEVLPTDLNDLVRKSTDMFGRTRKEIRISMDLTPELWTCKVDRGQIEQVLLNLFVNASQAMPEGGTLHVSTTNTAPAAADIAQFDVTARRFVCMSTTDSGCGIDPEILPRIFEPFYTTKEMGRGTGLGLASVYGIIKNHGGFVTVQSQKGAGSRFDVYLPAVDAEAVSLVEEQQDLQRGSETILLVDDEELILDVGRAMISNLGYEVMTAMGGQEAVEVFQKHKDAIDLVILDMIMPDMSGEKLFERLKAINPQVKALLASGYSMNDMAQKIIDQGCTGFIQKPFDLKRISLKLREVMAV